MTSAAHANGITLNTNTEFRKGVTYVYSIFNENEVNIKIKNLNKSTHVARIPSSITCDGVSITGGFSQNINNKMKPQGLVRTDERTISKIANWPDGGVISILQGHMQITRISTWRQSPINDGMALQGRPLLIVDGKVDEPLKRSNRMNRLAIGTLGDGRIAIVGAFTSDNEAVTMKEFAQDSIMLIPENIQTLLNLDGGPSAFLYSKDLKLLPSPGVVTTYICIEPR